MTKQINGDKLFVIDHHPAIPPSDLLKKWEDAWFDEEEHADVLLIQAFQAGADQELEACIDWLANARNHSLDWDEATYFSANLRTARRPKLQSLKERALELAKPPGTEGAYVTFGPEELALIRRALEQLND
jgi:hypothetical protein